MRTPKTQAELDKAVLDAFSLEQGAQIYDEIRQVSCIFNLIDVRSMIEIGCENGGSIAIWLKLWDDLKYFGVDLDSYGLKTSKEGRLARWKSWCNLKQSVEITWGDSHQQDTIDRLRQTLANHQLTQVDMLMVDGDHSELGTEQDYEMYKSFVRPGGVIVVQDIHPYVKDDGTFREDVMGWKWRDRFIPKPIPQTESREPHLRPNWQSFAVYNNFGFQRSFGFLFIFV